MNPRAVFGLSILMSSLTSIVIAALFAWPWLKSVNRGKALVWLVAPHMFLRFLGLSFLVPGVVSTALPRTWAAAAAYGDFLAGVLAIVATLALAYTSSWAAGAVWVFNVCGAADLLFAFYEGARVGLDPGSLGAGYYLVTAIVPLLLVSHALIFRLSLRSTL